MRNVVSGEFSDKVAFRSMTDGPVVVMFHADWCGPCQGMKPLMEKLALALDFPLFGVNAGNERDLAASYRVRAVPTLVVFKDGNAVSSSAGGKNEAQIRDFLYKAGVTQNVLEF